MFKPESHILIVDDMMTMRKLVKKSCSELGFSKFTEAADGALAWAALKEANPKIDVIISDWNMPNLTGLEFLKKVRADAAFKDLPFFLLTAEAEAKQVAEALAAGVSNYIVKPFTADTLRQKLEQTAAKLAKAG